MQHSEQIGDRVKELLAHYQLSTYEASQKLGYDRASKLYKLIKNETKPGYETILDLLQTFPELSTDWLLLGHGSMLRGGAADAPPTPKAKGAKPLVGAAERMPTVIAVTPDGEEEIMVVPIAAQAGYLRSGKDPDVLKDFGTLKLPGFEGRTYRAFEVDGDSMEPTIRRGDYVLGSFVDRWSLVKPGHVYIIETKSEFLVKRLRGPLPEGKPIEMLSDNRFYEPFVVDYEEVLEIWQVRGQLTRHIPANSSEAYERMLSLMEDMARDSQLLRHTLLEIATRFEVKMVPEGL